MLKNYCRTALRSLSRHKVHTFLNIASLSVGFAAFLLIFLVINYEESFDSFHANKDRLFRVVRIDRSPVNRQYGVGLPCDFGAIVERIYDTDQHRLFDLHTFGMVFYAPVAAAVPLPDCFWGLVLRRLDGWFDAYRLDDGWIYGYACGPC
jgi:hypothetical protein